MVIDNSEFVSDVTEYEVNDNIELFEDEYETELEDEFNLFEEESDEEDLFSVNTKSKRGTTIKKFVLVTLLGLVFVCCYIGVSYYHNNHVMLFTNIIEKSQVKQWLKAFSNKNYLYCDNLLVDSNFKLSVDNRGGQFLDTIEQELYTYTIDKLVDSIESYEIKSVKQDRNFNVYEVEFVIRPYKILTQESLEEVVIEYNDKIEDIKERYIDTEITAEEVGNEVANVYADIYRKASFKTDKEVKKVVKVYYLQENEKEKVEVGGVLDLLQDLLEVSNIRCNTDTYKEYISVIYDDLNYIQEY